MPTPFVPDYIRHSTQKQQVLWYLERVGSITSLDAIDSFTMTRLAAIIGFLEDDGYTFDHRSEIHSKGCHMRYYLTGGPGITKEDGQLNLGLEKNRR